MEFTGERYVPTLGGQIKYEHLHRYALCLDCITDKIVLDIASGEGYGSALFAKVARSVVGVDINKEAVEYASSRYQQFNNLKFLVGSCNAIPLLDKSIDVVVSFETIEHHDKHEEMMQEIKRVLKPEGVLIISSPNRLTYSDEPNYSNPFHVKELYYEELNVLLNRYFKYSQIYGQRLAAGSFIYALENTESKTLTAYTGNNEFLEAKVCSLPSPIYFVAVCSDEASEVRVVADSVYLDKSDDILKFFEVSWAEAKSELQQTQSELQQTQSELQRTQSELQCSQIQLQNLTEEANKQYQQIYLMWEETQTLLHQSQNEWEETQTLLHQSQNEWRRTQDIVYAMETSKFWKIRKKWFKLKELLGMPIK